MTIPKYLQQFSSGIVWHRVSNLAGPLSGLSWSLVLYFYSGLSFRLVPPIPPAYPDRPVLSLRECYNRIYHINIHVRNAEAIADGPHFPTDWSVNFSTQYKMYLISKNTRQLSVCSHQSTSYQKIPAIEVHRHMVHNEWQMSRNSKWSLRMLLMNFWTQDNFSVHGFTCNIIFICWDMYTQFVFMSPCLAQETYRGWIDIYSTHKKCAGI